MSETTSEAAALPPRSRALPIILAVAAGAVLAAGLAFMVSSSQQAGGAPGGGDIQLISAAGEQVDVTRHLAPGKFTVIDFYADWCANCKEITPVLEELARRRTDLALRKINIVHWDTPVVAQYRVTYLPYLQIYSPGGALLAEGADAVLSELKRRFPAG